MSGMSYKQRDIVLLPFPYTDLSSSKKRPAMVVSSNVFNSASGDVVCCLITTNPNEDRFTVKLSNSDVEDGVLHYESILKPYRIFTVDKKIVLKKLCSLKKQRFGKVMEKLRSLFAGAS